jgi:hypothetical protein
MLDMTLKQTSIPGNVASKYDAYDVRPKHWNDLIPTVDGIIYTVLETKISNTVLLPFVIYETTSLNIFWMYNMWLQQAIMYEFP